MTFPQRMLDRFVMAYYAAILVLALIPVLIFMAALEVADRLDAWTQTK